MRTYSGSLNIWYMRAEPNATALGATTAKTFVRDLAALASDSTRLEDINTAVNAEQSQSIGYPELKASLLPEAVTQVHQFRVVDLADRLDLKYPSWSHRHGTRMTSQNHPASTNLNIKAPGRRSRYHEIKPVSKLSISLLVACCFQEVPPISRG
jgi:hypothetical protein